jgi:kynurenine formamidase
VNLDLFDRHDLSRRRALGLAGAAAFTTATAGMLPGSASAAEPAEPTRSAAGHRFGRYTDEMFDVEAVLAGAWAPTRYGPEDQLGTFNEVTPAKTAAALRLVAGAPRVRTYTLGEEIFNGFPAYVTTPPRILEQRLVVGGFNPGPDFEGILQTTEPLGPNKVSVMEERFECPPDSPYTATYQIGTQLDNLNHIGVGPVFYNGFRGPEIVDDYGTTSLGMEVVPPVVTRGILIDILGLKVAQRQASAYFTAGNGERVLVDDYRITLEDIQAALRRQHIRGPRPGDAVLFRTGWTHLVRTDPERYVAGEPGIYLREARWLADRRPALIGSDTWALEVLAPAVTQGNVFPVHQELLVKNGIRIGEAIRTEELAADGVYEFVYITTPQRAVGATAGNAPPAALAPLRA